MRHMKSYETLLAEIRNAGAASDRISVGEILDRLGDRSFGPILLVAALPPMTPLAAIPGLATILAIVIFLTAGQMLIRRPHIWLPSAILRRSVPCERITRTVDILDPVARFAGKIVKPRLEFMLREPFHSIIAACCCLLALTMPPLEFVPFTSGIPCFPVAVFGLALLTNDGLLALTGLSFLVVALTAVAFLLL